MASQAVRSLKEQAPDELSKLRGGQVTSRIESILFPDEPLHVPKGGQTGGVGLDGGEARLELHEDGGSLLTEGLQSDSFGLLMMSSLIRLSC